MKYWDDYKQVGPILLRIKLDFKTNDKDLKIWYKIGTKSGNDEGINVILPLSKRKNHLSGGHRRLCESLRVKDPSKGYLFADPKDIKVDLEVTVAEDHSAYKARGIGIGQGTSSLRNTGGTKVVQYATDNVNIYTEDNNDHFEGYDEDLYGSGNNNGGRDDNAAYYAFQNNESGTTGDYTITGNNQISQETATLLNLDMNQVGADPQDDFGGQQVGSGNSSTNAVADMDAAEGQDFEGGYYM